MCRFPVSAELPSCCVLARQSWRFDWSSHHASLGQSNSKVELLKPEIFWELSIASFDWQIFPRPLLSLCPHRSSFLSPASRCPFFSATRRPRPFLFFCLWRALGSQRANRKLRAGMEGEVRGPRPLPLPLPRGHARRSLVRSLETARRRGGGLCGSVDGRSRRRLTRQTARARARRGRSGFTYSTQFDGRTDGSGCGVWTWSTAAKLPSLIIIHVVVVSFFFFLFFTVNLHRSRAPSSPLSSGVSLVS